MSDTFEMIQNRHDTPAPPYAQSQNMPTELSAGDEHRVGAAAASNAPVMQHSTGSTKPYSPDDYSQVGPQQNGIQIVPNVASGPTLNVTPLKLLRDQPAYVDCPFCRTRQKTRPEQKDSDKTWLAVLVTCLICPCVACLPLNCCMGWLQDIDQYCEGCGEKLTHKPYDKEVQVLHHGETETQPSQYAQPPQPMYQAQQPSMPVSPYSQPDHHAPHSPYSQPVSPLPQPAKMAPSH